MFDEEYSFEEEALIDLFDDGELSLYEQLDAAYDMVDDETMKALINIVREKAAA